MSIYATVFSLDEFDHLRGCNKFNGPRGFDGRRKCDCGQAPLVYQGSHILPSDLDERGGAFGLCAIPGHISRPGREALSSGMRPYWPYLRVSMFREKHFNAGLIITRQQAEAMRDVLNEWLRES